MDQEENEEEKEADDDFCKFFQRRFLSTEIILFF